MLTEENDRLRRRCQDLEDLVNEEETDIGDVLELIKKMQSGDRSVSLTCAFLVYGREFGKLLGVDRIGIFGC